MKFYIYIEGYDLNDDGDVPGSTFNNGSDIEDLIPVEFEDNTEYLKHDTYFPVMTITNPPNSGGTNNQNRKYFDFNDTPIEYTLTENLRSAGAYLSYITLDGNNTEHEFDPYDDSDGNYPYTLGQGAEGDQILVGDPQETRSADISGSFTPADDGGGYHINFTGLDNNYLRNFLTTGVLELITPPLKVQIGRFSSNVSGGF